MPEIIIIVLMALITFALRFLPLLFIKSPEDLPKWMQKWFYYIPPAILTAVTVQATVGAVEGFGKPSYLVYIAYVVCGIVAFKTKDIFKSLAFGMFTLLIVNAIL